MNLEVVSILLFFAVVSFLLYRDRKNLQIYGKILIIRKTRRGIKALKNFATRHRKFLTLVGNVAIVIGVIASAYGLYLTFQKALSLQQAVKLVLPQPAGVKFPSFVQGVPFWYWLIAVFVIVSVHEPMHALFALVEKVRVKEMGLIFLGPLPIGAFANPDERGLQKLSCIKKLRVYVAGSFGNILVAGITILLFLLLLNLFHFFFTNVLKPTGVVFDYTIEGYPASKANLTGVITSINGHEIRDIRDLFLVLKDTPPGTTVRITTTIGNYTLKTVASPYNSSFSFIGIQNPRTLYSYSGKPLPVYLSDLAQNFANKSLSLLSWLFQLNLGVAIFNLFPIKPLDGGLMLEEVLKKALKNKKLATKVANAISFLVLGFVLFSLVGPSLVRSIFG